MLLQRLLQPPLHLKLLHSKVMLLRKLLKLLQPMLRLRLLQPQRLLLLVLHSHRAWVHLVVQFRHLQVAVVQFLLLLVVQVELLALVVHLWVVVLQAQVLVLAPVVFLQVHLVAVR